MIQAEIKKPKPGITVEIVEYEPHAVVSKTIINKTTGKVNVMSFDIGEALVETTMPCESFVQVIEGSAEIVIGSIPHNIETGEAIIIPAHTPNIVRANERFKMILTVIKAGYESRTHRWHLKSRTGIGRTECKGG